MTRKTTAAAVTIIYLAGAVWVLAAFLLAPPDGLANIWIAAWTLPVTLLGLVLLDYPFGIGFPFAPSGTFGYCGSHAVYFVPVALFLAALIYRLVAGRS